MPASRKTKSACRSEKQFLQKIYRLIILFLLFPFSLSAQFRNHTHYDEHEFAIIPGAVYDLGSKNFAWSLHGHFLTSAGQQSESISAGISVEYIMGDETHFTAGPAVSVSPWGRLVLIYSPGITFRNGDEGSDYYFSNHFEVAMEFELFGLIHIGPSAGFSMSGYDNHAGVGIHFGFEL